MRSVALLMAAIFFFIGSFQPIFHELGHYLGGTTHPLELDKVPHLDVFGEVNAPGPLSLQDEHQDCEWEQLCLQLAIHKEITILVALCVAIVLASFCLLKDALIAKCMQRKLYFLPLSCGPPA